MRHWRVHALNMAHAVLVADVNHLEEIQKLATRMKSVLRYILYEDKVQRLGFHSL